jgi:two-component system sensor histidine kinase DesK
MDKIKRILAGPWTPPRYGKLPYLWVLSLAYFLQKYWHIAPTALELGLVALTVVLFLPLYFASFWARSGQSLLSVLLTCLIGAVWAPFNPCSGTFFIFACAMCAGIVRTRHAYLMLAAVLALAVLVALALPANRLIFLLPALTIGLPVGIASVMDAGLARSRELLLRKQEEVEHMATIAERERISRDLHDLLGHSLSLIALKAELAGKLAGRDPAACLREIRDIETSARQALSEVRAAVTGYRQGGLVHALASARSSLAAAEVELHEDVQRFALAPAAEHVVALALREAVTNVVRHARASRCTLSLALEQGIAVLRVADDGASLGDKAGIRHGNGLAGMQERAAALGGKLAIDVANGLALELRVPSGVAA